MYYNNFLKKFIFDINILKLSEKKKIEVSFF